jgi:hypothetical protein
MTHQRRAIIITSIFPPTEAVRAFAQLDAKVVVVGDEKSPPDWACPGVEYLSPKAQLASEFRLVELLPWNHYARKMVGYLWAARDGASIIFDTDDDNIPLHEWDFPVFDGPFLEVDSDSRFYNVYRHYTDDFVWPRGFPLRLLRHEVQLRREVKQTAVGVWQGLADGEPDVDAIFRLVSDGSVNFRENDPVTLAAGLVCPFNSQNTAFRKEVFPLLYLPAFVTFRFTDILRSLVAQPILWAAGFRVGFTGPNVYQQRNPHDLLQDFESEVPMYLEGERVVSMACDAVQPAASVQENLRAVYATLAEAGVVSADELLLLDLWLADIESVLVP